MGCCAQIVGTRKPKIPLLFLGIWQKTILNCRHFYFSFPLIPPNLLPKLTGILGIGNFDFPKKWSLFGQSASSSFFLLMWSTTRQIFDGPSIPPVSMLVPGPLHEYCNFAGNLNNSINTMESIAPRFARRQKDKWHVRSCGAEVTCLRLEVAVPLSNHKASWEKYKMTRTGNSRKRTHCIASPVELL